MGERGRTSSDAAVKLCTKCGETKPVTEFGRDRPRRDGLTYWCRSCLRAYRQTRTDKTREYARQHYQANRATRREQGRAAHLRRTFGLTEAEYQAMLEAQGGGCAICGVAPGERAHPVDHDHESGRVRGILCDHCNRGLGCFADDPDRLAAAAAYLAARPAPRPPVVR